MAVIALDQQNFDSIIDTHSFIIIDFSAPWCEPCKGFAKVFEAVSEQFPNIAFASCDIEANAEIAQDFHIQSVPHLMILKEQVAVFDESGALAKDDLLDLIEQAKQLDVAALRAQLETQL